MRSGARTGTIRRLPVRTAVVMVVALLAAACGSTLSSRHALRASGGSNPTGDAGLGGTATGSSQSGGGASGPGSGTGDAGGGSGAGGGGPTWPTGANGSANGPGLGGGGANPGAAGETGGTGTGSNGSNAGGSSGSLRAGPVRGSGSAQGVTATTILVGVPYSVNGAAADKAIGASGITQGDEKSDYQIVINDFNAHGGILGRKIVPVFHALDATDPSTTDAKYQAACADFTQDHHVFAVFGGNSDSFVSCLEKAGVVPISADFTQADDQTFRTFPHYIETSSLDLTRQARVVPDGLFAQGYFGRSPKIGIVAFDLPGFTRAVNGILIPDLRGHGFNSIDTVFVNALQSNGDLGTLSAQVSNAALKFRAEGVDHVLLQDIQGVLTLEFLQQAASQRYYPRYGFGTPNGGQALAPDLPAAALHGTLQVGWLPIEDIGAAQDPDAASSPARRRCLALYAAHQTTFADRNAETVGLAVCQETWFLRAALTQGGALSPQGLLDGVARLGDSFSPTINHANHYDANQHDGVSGVRYGAYDDGCSCFKYTSGVINVG